MSYEPEKIEPAWQRRWATEHLYRIPDRVRGKKNRMVLVEFPYPSGDLHAGHWYAFALPDMHARYSRMTGHNVMYPIGFDAFGLPAENAAIQRGLHPEAWTRANISRMTAQLESMGAMFDWSREVRTIDPDYYRWTQWMFNRMFEKGLAYRAQTNVNWCPKDRTVLANEQVVDGCCERCGTEVIQKHLEQWMMRTTRYASRLVDGIEGLDWPRTTRLAQENWIGRSRGARIIWKLKIPDQPDTHTVETFTTRPDTIFGVTFLVISPEKAREWMDAGWEAPKGVKDYVARALRKRELERMEGNREKTGSATGIHAVNPLSGELIPVWVADYVLGSYGTGAIMAVPAHDERDAQFAAQFGLPVSDAALQDADAVVAELKKKHAGEAQTTFKLRDWVISRQRYWGVPIPLVHCAVCGYVPVPDADLPVKLPPLEDFKPTEDGRSPLARAAEWLRVKCPQCGDWAERETDTMDTFVDSSWYFLRYTDPKNAREFASKATMKHWLPVPLYVGGAEHNTMHLLYARFFTKVLHELGYLPFDEPFTARRNHGIIMGPDGQKMSKSRGNVVDPDEQVTQYGADTVRMYLAFMGPYEQGGPWDTKGIVGVRRFLNRVWDLFQKPAARKGDEETERALNDAVKAVGDDLATLSFNTCVSTLMKLLNTTEDRGTTLTKNQRERFVLLLAPLAPHIAEELWRAVLKKKTSVHTQPWPTYDAALSKTKTVPVPVQVNGRVRAVLQLPGDMAEDDAIAAAKNDEAVARHLEGREPSKVIYLPGRLLNLVIS
ncbi:MAG TPA: class I tRNA ligase family protein [Candidatus Paceibacterota bacterium]|nr:class I tRNA ligase family protein [Candidatus Paceibacterota bacterium]